MCDCNHPRVVFEAERDDIENIDAYSEIVTLPAGYRVISAFMPGVYNSGWSSSAITCNGWRVIRNEQGVSNGVGFQFTVNEVDPSPLTVRFQVLAERCDASDVYRSDATLTHGN